MTYRCRKIQKSRSIFCVWEEKRGIAESISKGRWEQVSSYISELVTMLREEIILTNSPGWPGLMAAISVAPSPASHPYHTHTIIPSLSPLYHHPTPVTPQLSHRPASQAGAAHHTPPRRSCLTWGSAASSNWAECQCTPSLYGPLGVWPGQQSAALTRKLPHIFCC